MPAMTEKPHAGAFIMGAARNGDLSFVNIVVAQGPSVLNPGTVLGQITNITLATAGLFVPVNFAASDGSQIAACILFDRCDPTLGTVVSAVLARNAEVRADMLIWPSSGTPSQIAIALSQLASALIVAR